jgi:hypothetical protein
MVGSATLRLNVLLCSKSLRPPRSQRSAISNQLHRFKVDGGMEIPHCRGPKLDCCERFPSRASYCDIALS